MKKVAIIMGGPGGEHEVSLATGREMLKNLPVDKYAIKPILIDPHGKWQFGDSTRKFDVLEAMQRLRSFDVALLALHGTFGEDGRVQALLEAIELPYTGAGIAASALAMDKLLSTSLFKAAGLKVPQSIVFDEVEWQGRKSLPKCVWPVIVKPVSGGSSVGMAKVKQSKDLLRAIEAAFKHDTRVMLQEYLIGREFTCGVLERDGEVVALPPTEIIPNTSDFFDYAAKYEIGASLEVTPPLLPAKQIAKLQDLALLAHRTLQCLSYSRSDFILTKRGFVILELNTLPGMTPTSLFPQAAAAAGLSFSDLLDTLIQNALT